MKDPCQRTRAKTEEHLGLFFSSGSSEQGFKNTTSIVFVCQPKCHPFLRDLAVGRKSRAGKITRLRKDATNGRIVILATVQEKGRTKSARKEDHHLIFVLKEEPFLPLPSPNTRTEELARSPRSGRERTNRGGRRRRQWRSEHELGDWRLDSCRTPARG